MLRAIWTWLTFLPQVARLGRQIPFKGIAAILDTLDEGRTGKYAGEPQKWRRVGVVEHWTHASDHYYRWRKGCAKEAHMPHAATRMVMACEQANTNVGRELLANKKG